MVDDLLNRRWNGKTGSAADHSPVDALRIALDQHERGEIQFKHIIVVYSSEPVEGKTQDGCGFYQAGPATSTTQIGLLEYAKGAMLEHLLSEAD